MSDDECEQEETEVLVEPKYEEESSEEPPMSEWSSLIIKFSETNIKKKLYEEGLYDPGSGEVCAAYIAQSDSEVLRHVYYNYPSIEDPGIEDALLRPPPKITYSNDGQDLYLATCKIMNQAPVRIFHRALLDSHINLSYYGVNPNGVRAMAMALQNNNYVTHLNLTDNWLNDDACFHLGQMLMTNSKITHLNLYGCRIGPSGLLRLCEGLPPNRTLSVLDLGANQIGDEGLEHLARAVHLQSDVRELNLSHNGITGKGTQFLAEALEIRNKLTSMDLSYNNLYSSSSGLCKLLDQLGTNSEFRMLNIAWNSLSGERIAASLKNVFQAKHLRYVNLNNNKLCGTETIETLSSNMRKPKEMECFDLSFNPLTKTDTLILIRKLEDRRCKIKELNLGGVNVNQEFVKILENIKLSKKVEVTYGYLECGFKATGKDTRELVLDRVEYIAKKNKKRKMDIALVVLQLIKDKVYAIEPKELAYISKPYGVYFDEDLLNAMEQLWSAPAAKKGGKRIDLVALAEYISRKWPERQLPPTPPPEPEPEPLPVPVPDPNKKKGKKKK